MFKRFFIGLQYILPQHGLSALTGWLANRKTVWIKKFFIKCFIKFYHVDMSLALIENPNEYPTFNDFFTRRLKPELRPIDNQGNSIVSPADGIITQIGSINKEQLLQVKGSYFNLQSLLADDKGLTEIFYDGLFATFYLAPKDYHRFHMPLTGTLDKMIYVPGKLFSVSQSTIDYIPNLYSRNERLILTFDTEAGTMGIIVVGAMIVGSIKTVWTDNQDNQPVTLQKGDELGYFKMGSTIIVLFSKNKIHWEQSLGTGSVVNFGQAIGSVNN